MKHLSLPILAIITIFCSVDTTESQDANPVVKTSFGELRGKYLISRDGRQYSAFLGIPYAKPVKRFQVSEFPDNWENTRNATNFGKVCPQAAPKHISFISPVTGDENCLFLNVYSPKINGDLPVMVFIHGGGFNMGSSDTYTGKYFMDENIVLVTINYRLGALGFLNTGDGEMEGNLGLKDQNLALKWIQQNIGAFGGNAAKITIFGESAGSASVHYHMLSPLSKGLFSKAILQSGAALNPWAFEKNPGKSAFALGKSLGCNAENSTSLIECLQKATVNDIVNATERLPTKDIPFPPSLENPKQGKQPFLVDTPINIIKSGKYNAVTTIFMACEHEGSLFAAPAMSKAYFEDLNKEYPTQLPQAMKYDDKGYSNEQQRSISAKIKKFYFGKSVIGVHSFDNLTNMYSDRMFFDGIAQSAALHSKMSTVFISLFTYKGIYSIERLLSIKRKGLGVTHADELQYFFPSPFFPEFSPGSKVDNASKYFLSLWVNFAATGNPGAKWPRLQWDALDQQNSTAEGMNWWSLDFPPENLNAPFKERLQFWEKTLQK